MFPYTENYTESESDIQNNDSFYKIGEQCPKTFELLTFLGKFEESFFQILISLSV